MEQNIFSKFNVYEQIGYLMVGAVAVILVILDALYFHHLTLPAFSIDTFIIWLVVVFFTGHLVQGISNIINKLPLLKYLIRENKEEFTEQEKEILQKAKDFFKVEEQDDNRLWNLCYMLSTAKDLTGHIQVFNATYSLYRGWLVIFLMQSVYLAAQLIISYTMQTLVLFIASIFLCYVFFSRSKRFWSYTRKKVLETFLIIKMLEK